jgi:hypothetical protein
MIAYSSAIGVILIYMIAYSIYYVFHHVNVNYDSFT